MTEPEATPLRLSADQGTRVLAGGRVLLGGAPLRVLRLSEAGARLVAGWLAGEPVATRPAHRKLAARLVRAGIAHPRYASRRLGRRDVTVVVPVRDHGHHLAALRGALGEVAGVIVVDDGSVTPVPGAAVRHDTARGPAAARNAGWRRAATELVAFVDADITPSPGWLEPLLAHFEDPGVVAVAPRVRTTPGPTLLAGYERERSPLDLGDLPSEVRPGGRVSYVPTAAVVVRASALADHRGFDERLRFGEDVDLVWRLARGGGRVRYEPNSVVAHEPRRRWSAWLAQRFHYGTSAAPLAARHPTATAPVRVSVWSAAAWAAIAAGRPLAGLAIAGATAGLLPRKLGPAGVPARESLALAGYGHLGAGRVLADGVTRHWWPLAVPLLATTRRGRWLLAMAAGRHLLDWRERRPPIDPARWLAVRVADDLAYGAGVWWGALRHRTLAPLWPDLSDWPGRDGVVAPESPGQDGGPRR